MPAREAAVDELLLQDQEAALRKHRVPGRLVVPVGLGRTGNDCLLRVVRLGQGEVAAVKALRLPWASSPGGAWVTGTRRGNNPCVRSPTPTLVMATRSPTLHHDPQATPIAVFARYVAVSMSMNPVKETPSAKGRICVAQNPPNPLERSIQ